jgi:glycosyltransferase involved in cell wall biosynthesis
MDVSVIVCTYNRARNLHGCLERLARQQGVEDVQWEVVVVDNNSTDNTRDEVDQLARELPITIRYAFEEKQGLNHARNRGALESRGRYFCYIDDDILVSDGWLASLREALEKSDADAVGGRIHLDNSIALPAWIRPEMYGVPVRRQHGFQPPGDR